MRSFYFLAFLAIAFGPPASAQSQPYESTRLFSKGAWSVELTHNTNSGTLWCSSDTTNQSGQSFSIAAFDDGSLILVVFDSRWNIAERNLRFLVNIDYFRRYIDGSGSGSSVSIEMNETEKSIKFLNQLMEGNAVAVFNSDGRRLATFSLNGSYAATRKLFSCWEKISLRDPFSSPSDPFGGNADPFD